MKHEKPLTGPALREARQARGQTMEEAAALIGVTLITLSRWERKGTTPTKLGKQAIVRWLNAHPAAR